VQHAALINAITAASESLTTRMEMGNNQIGEGWQNEVRELFYRVPELRTAARITGRAMSQCRLLCARVAPNGEPVPLDIGTAEKPGKDADHPAAKLLQKFAGGAGGQAAMLDQMGVLFATTGEGILVGKVNPLEADSANDFDRMQVYSPQQVVGRNRQIVVKLDDSTRADKTMDEDEGYTAVRVWRPDPFHSWKADSAAKSSLSVLREIALYDDRIRATAISRLAGPGLLFVNEDVTLPVSLSEDEPESEGTLDPFMVLLMEVMSMAMKDQNSAAARTPILVRAKDPSTAAHLMTFDSPFDDKILELRKSALDRFSVAVDMPGEILSGLGDLQHWTGALVTEDWKKTYLPELMGLFCGSLTSGWLVKSLAAAGYGDIPNDVIIWYDDSSVRTREQVGPEAQAAYDRGEIGGNALRRMLGYDEGDAPDFTTEAGKQQLALMLVLKAPSLAPALAKYLHLDGDWSKIIPGGTVPGGAAGQNLPVPGQDPNTAKSNVPAEAKQEPLTTPVPTSLRSNGSTPAPARA
jgi:hypothetical protein